MNGQPLKEGLINLHDANRGVGFGGTITDGKFVIDEPVSAGDYKVAVMPPPPPPPDEKGGAVVVKSEIPDRYRLGETSGLTATVKQGEENVLTFDLK